MTKHGEDGLRMREEISTYEKWSSDLLNRPSVASENLRFGACSEESSWTYLGTWKNKTDSLLSRGRMVSFANSVFVDNVKLHSACRRIPR